MSFEVVGLVLALGVTVGAAFTVFFEPHSTRLARGSKRPEFRLPRAGLGVMAVTAGLAPLLLISANITGVWLVVLFGVSGAFGLTLLVCWWCSRLKLAEEVIVAGWTLLTVAGLFGPRLLQTCELLSFCS